ncbi:hypothetical protein F5Y04DRAFT_280726 [Hypomontagnella monticulosa]|nr:hypothetical protein F5Y04DRAFT_280726 [Hypomontagnella monticulosa]
MDSQVDIVKRYFYVDVAKRAVVNTSAKEPCVCGCYQYYSQRCGCLYKSVHLKCGKTKSSNGNVILCREGRRRKIRVESAVVPFRCPLHRNGYAPPITQQKEPHEHIKHEDDTHEDDTHEEEEHDVDVDDADTH